MQNVFNHVSDRSSHTSLANAAKNKIKKVSVRCVADWWLLYRPKLRCQCCMAFTVARVEVILLIASSQITVRRYFTFCILISSQTKLLVSDLSLRLWSQCIPDKKLCYRDALCQSKSRQLSKQVVQRIHVRSK